MLDRLRGGERVGSRRDAARTAVGELHLQSEGDRRSVDRRRQDLRYEQDLGRNRRRDVTLPAAVAMSGAALAHRWARRPTGRCGACSPSRTSASACGSPTRRTSIGRTTGARGEEPRLGAEPGAVQPAAQARLRANSVRHRPRPTYLWREIFGRNRLEGKFLYVTDGGHYENLGLVELLRRGCRTIYCFDAGGGTTSGALGDAIALARKELNVEIEMLPEALELAEDPETKRSIRACARGRIVYRPGPDGKAVEGTLFYARSVVCEKPPGSC